VSEYVSYSKLSGWWLSPTPLKNMKVNWDDDIPNIWKVIKFMFQTTNQLWIIYGFHMISSMMWGWSLTSKLLLFHIRQHRDPVWGSDMNQPSGIGKHAVRSPFASVKSSNFSKISAWFGFHCFRDMVIVNLPFCWLEICTVHVCCLDHNCLLLNQNNALCIPSEAGDVQASCM